MWMMKHDSKDIDGWKNVRHYEPATFGDLKRAIEMEGHKANRPLGLVFDPSMVSDYEMKELITCYLLGERVVEGMDFCEVVYSVCGLGPLGSEVGGTIKFPMRESSLAVWEKDGVNQLVIEIAGWYERAGEDYNPADDENSHKWKEV